MFNASVIQAPVKRGNFVLLLLLLGWFHSPRGPKNLLRREFSPFFVCSVARRATLRTDFAVLRLVLYSSFRCDIGHIILCKIV